MPGPMDETKSVSIHYKPNASTSTARPRQKSGPKRGQNCITVYFPIVIETPQNITCFSITIGKRTVIQFLRLVGPLFWRGRALEVLAFGL